MIFSGWLGQESPNYRNSRGICPPATDTRSCPVYTSYSDSQVNPILPKARRQTMIQCSMIARSGERYADRECRDHTRDVHGGAAGIAAKPDTNGASQMCKTTAGHSWLRRVGSQRCLKILSGRPFRGILLWRLSCSVQFIVF